MILIAIDNYKLIYNKFIFCMKTIRLYLTNVIQKVIFNSVVDKNGSFGFAKGWFVSWAKPNVPFVGWL